jgi:hypothetical protein
LIETDKIIIKALWNTEAIFFVVSNRLVSRAEYQRINRDHVIRIRDYAGRAKPGGQSYTKPLPFSLAKRKFSEAMKIASLADNLRYEIIIPNWWIEESGLAIRGQNGVYEVINSQTTTSLSESICESIHVGNSVDGKLGK